MVGASHAPVRPWAGQVSSAPVRSTRAVRRRGIRVAPVKQLIPPALRHMWVATCRLHRLSRETRPLVAHDNTIVPTTAPVKLCIPPTTSIAVVSSVILR